MRVAPLLRASELRALRGLIKAAPAVWPYAHGTLDTPIERATREAEKAMHAGVAERMAVELARQAEERGSPPTTIPELAAAGSPTIDRAADRQGQAPEGTRGAAAVVEMVPANACPAAHVLERATVQQDRPGPRPASVEQDAAAPDPLEDGDDESAADFAARVAAAGARRARILAKPEPIDWNRVADAHARKAAESRAVPVVGNLPVAHSPEECRRCGIPGRKGCAHQAPYVAVPVGESPYSMGKRHSYDRVFPGARA